MKKISDIPELDRPREKLLGKAAPALSDLELIAVILGKGTEKLRFFQNNVSKFYCFMDKLFGAVHGLGTKKKDKGQNNYKGRALISNSMICLKNSQICTLIIAKLVHN
ncbi:MAG: UPF0758 domain-containing protein [Desulfobacterales bacterium]